MANLDNNFKINKDSLKSNPGYNQFEQDSLVQQLEQQQTDTINASPFRNYLDKKAPTKKFSAEQMAEATRKNEEIQNKIRLLTHPQTTEDKYIQAMNEFLGETYHTPDQEKHTAMGQYLAIANAYASEDNLLNGEMKEAMYKHRRNKDKALINYYTDQATDMSSENEEDPLYTQQKLINEIEEDLNALLEKRNQPQEEPLSDSEQIPLIKLKDNREKRTIEKAIRNFDMLAPYILNPDLQEVYNQFNNYQDPEELLKNKQSYINYVASAQRTSQGVTFLNANDKKIKTEVQAVDTWIHDNIAQGTVGNIGGHAFAGLSALATIPLYAKKLWDTKGNPSLDYIQYTKSVGKGVWDTLWGTVGGLATGIYETFSRSSESNQNEQAFSKALDNNISEHGQVFQNMQKEKFKDIPEWQSITKDGASKAKQLLSQISGAYVHRDDYNVDLKDSQLQELWENFALLASSVGEETAMQMMARNAEKSLYNEFQNSGLGNRMSVGWGKAWNAFSADVVATAVSFGAVLSNPDVFIGNADMIEDSEWLEYASNVMESGYVSKSKIQEWKNQDPLLRRTAFQNLQDPDREMDFWNENTLETMFSLFGQYGFTAGTTLLSFGTSLTASTITELASKNVSRNALRRQMVKLLAKNNIKKNWFLRNFGNLSRQLDDDAIRLARRNAVLDRQTASLKVQAFKKPLLFMAGLLGTAEGSLEARSTYDETLLDLQQMNDAVYDKQHQQELNAVRGEANAFYDSNPDIVEAEIRNFPDKYGAVVADTLVHGINTEQDFQNAQMSYAYLYQKAKQALIDSAVQEYRLNDDDYLSAYEKADATALTAGYMNFWFNSAINGMLNTTLKSRQLSKEMREALSNKKKLLKKSINFVKDPKNAVLQMRAEAVKEPLWKKTISNLWNTSKEALGEGLEEYEQGLSNAFSQGYAQSAYTAYLVNNYNPGSTEYMGLKLLSPIFGTQEDISLLYYSASGGAKNALNMATSTLTLKEGMFGFLSTLIGGPNISARFGINSFKKAGQLIMHPLQSLKEWGSNTWSDIKLGNIMKTIFEDLPLFDNGFVVWRTSLTNAYMEAKENTQIVNDAIDRINTTLLDPNKSKLWNLLSGQSQINEAFNLAAQKGDELDLNDSNLQSLIQTALIIQASRESAVGQAYLKNLQRLANLSDEQLKLVFDNEGNFIGEQNIQTKEAKDLWDLLKLDIALYDKEYVDNSKSGKSKIDLMRRNASEQLKFLEEVDTLGKQYESLFGSDITEDTKASLIMGDMLINKYKEQSEELKGLFDRFKVSLGSTETSDAKPILKQLIAKYGQNVLKGIENQYNTIKSIIELLDQDIENAKEGIEKKQKQSLRKFLLKRLQRVETDLKVYNKSISGQYDNEQHKEGKKGILEENQQTTTTGNEEVITETAERITGEQEEIDTENIVLTEADIMNLSNELRESMLNDSDRQKSLYSSEQLAVIDALKKKWEDFLKQLKNDGKPVESYYKALRRYNHLMQNLDLMAQERQFALDNVDKINAFGKMLKDKEQLSVLVESFKPLLDSDQYDRWDKQSNDISTRAAEVGKDPNYSYTIREAAVKYLMRKRQDIKGLNRWLSQMNDIVSKIKGARGDIKQDFEAYVRAVGVLYTVMSDKAYDNNRQDIENRLANGGALDVIKEILSNPQKYIDSFTYTPLPVDLNENKEIDREKAKQENEKLDKVLENDKNGIEDLDTAVEKVANLILNILSEQKKGSEERQNTSKTPQITQSSTTTTVKSAAEQASNNPPPKVEIKPEQPRVSSTVNVMQPREVIAECDNDMSLYDTLCALGWEQFIESFKASDYQHPENSFRLIRTRIAGYDVTLACAEVLNPLLKGINVGDTKYGVLGVVNLSKADSNVDVATEIVTDKDTLKQLSFSIKEKDFKYTQLNSVNIPTLSLLDWVVKKGISFKKLIKRLFVENNDVKLREGTGGYRRLNIITDLKQLIVKVGENIMSVKNFFESLGEGNDINTDNIMIQSWKECVKKCVEAKLAFIYSTEKEKRYSLLDFINIVTNKEKDITDLEGKNLYLYVNLNIQLNSGREREVTIRYIGEEEEIDGKTVRDVVVLTYGDKTFISYNIEELVYQLFAELCDNDAISLNIPAASIKGSLKAISDEMDKDSNLTTLEQAELKATVLPSLLKMGALKIANNIVGNRDMQITVNGDIKGQNAVEQQPQPQLELPPTPVESIDQIEESKQRKMRLFIDSLIENVLSKTSLTQDEENYHVENDDTHLFHRVTSLIHRLVGGVIEKYNSNNPYNNKAISLGNTVDGITRKFFGAVLNYTTIKPNNVAEITEENFWKLCADVYTAYAHETGFLPQDVNGIEFRPDKEGGYAPRRFVNNEWVKQDIPNLSPYGFIQLMSHLVSVHKMCVARKWQIIPQDVAVKGVVKSVSDNSEEQPVAGTLDLLVIDEKGKLKVIDIKTMHFDTGEDAIDNKDPKVQGHITRWSAQVTMYKNLLEQEIRSYVDTYNAQASPLNRISTDDIDDLWAENPLCIFPMGVRYEKDLQVKRGNKVKKQVTRTVNGLAYTIEVDPEMTDALIDALPEEEVKKGVKMQTSVTAIVIEDDKTEVEKEGNYRIVDGYLIGVSEYNNGNMLIRDVDKPNQDEPDSNKPYTGVKDTTPPASPSNINNGNGGGRGSGTVNLDDTKQSQLSRRISKKRKFEIRRSIKPGKKISKKQFLTQQVNRVLGELLSPWASQDILKITGLSINAIVRAPLEAAAVIVQNMRKYYTYKMQTMRDTINNFEYMRNRDILLYKLYNGEKTYAEVYKELLDKGDDISQMTVLREYEEADTEQRSKIREGFMKKYKTEQDIIEDYRKQINALKAVQLEYNERLELMQSGIAQATIMTAIQNTVDAVQEAMETQGMDEFDSNMIVYENTSKKLNMGLQSFLKDAHIDTAKSHDISGFMALLESRKSNAWNDALKHILSQLADILKDANIPVRFINDAEDTRLGTTVMDDKEIKEVVINLANIDNVDTLATAIVHEATHVCTEFMIKEDTGIKEDIQQMIDYIKRYIEMDGTNPHDVYGLRSPSEFVAEFFSNPLFQTMLKNIPYIENKTIFQRFVAFVMNLFKGTPQSVYNRVEGYMNSMLLISSLLAHSGTKVKDRKKFVEQVRHFKALVSTRTIKFNTLSDVVLKRIQQVYKLTANTFEALPRDMLDKVITCCDWI